MSPLMPSSDQYYSNQPTSIGVLTSAFAAIRCSTTGRCPFWQAKNSGVVPSCIDEEYLSDGTITAILDVENKHLLYMTLTAESST